MKDEKIIELFLKRDEAAVSCASEKYGAYCTAVAGRILADRSDVEECVSDTWLGAWNSIPPHVPKVLRTFLGRITRNLSLKRRRDLSAAKRGGD
ncbi:MAG: RNA polymerase subunit sigma-70, partial [Firmicutes bacterium]|nr:RNA polymerase subunit sigma-70 [Bacillota bacterium]